MESQEGQLAFFDEFPDLQLKSRYCDPLEFNGCDLLVCPWPGQDMWLLFALWNVGRFFAPRNQRHLTAHVTSVARVAWFGVESRLSNHWTCPAL